MAETVVIDAGHGGSDFGATYNGRKEKDDNLNLALAVGDILKQNGVDVYFTRTSDVYNTPYEKAVMGNNSGADFFVSIHRNAVPESNTSTGIETLVYDDSGIKAEMARNINANLAALGFGNRGVIERPNLVVLKRTKMPAVLVEAGFINNDKDNELFDTKFNEIAQAIADGILETIRETGGATGGSDSDLYRVQVGAYRNRSNAVRLVEQLQREGFPAFLILDKDLYKVQVGAFENMDNAVRMEQRLRQEGYNTFITT
ncbi:MAG: N-acetylmuramoyl-L-alanine amidase [Lachnospiraceae bacterium]|nr:N-acetylmuramoyl-L-alanine amidase [Lachnospiraceae bacterium]